jgi:prolyl oligopeptidase
MVGDSTAPGIVFTVESWGKPVAAYAYDSGRRHSTQLSLVQAPPADFAGIESMEVNATSADGTAIPLSIVYRRGLENDGSRPTWLTAYGSHARAQDATFSPRRIAWLEQGGVYAVAHVRGGGEYGERWHLAGKKQYKQNSVDDFIACARYLIEHHYTSASYLAAEGASAGGITIGGAITQHPELFGAAIIRAGVSDAIRNEIGPGGPGNVKEYGSAQVPEDFPWLYAMSPYHHVQDGVKYPAIMLTGAANDARVPLWQPGKMAARLQAATGSGRPVLLRIEYEGGHGYTHGTTSTQLNEELADCYAFLLWQLGPRH